MQRAVMLAALAIPVLAGTALAQSREGPLVAAGAAQVVEREGEGIYRSVCQGCHMADGAGARGAATYPSLVNNQNLAAGGYPVSIIVNGLRAMPPVGAMMDDAQVAAVVNFIRTKFGNAYTDAVGAEDVKAVR
jgi:mono/diheme cytochrome c family protein